ncbi:MAG: MipA/OmpV family protein [Deltaproteobacteria bacterium]|nr:MipA/OmpV family protein [Deltaproteobacteria bacterium]
MRIRLALAAFMLLCFLLPENALCEEKPLWEAGVGLALLQMPDYRGADENRFYALPYPYFIYRGDILRVERERISGRIFKTDRLLVDVSFFGAAPVNSDHNSARSGMPDLDPMFEVGPSLNITLLEDRQAQYKLTFSLPVRAVFSTDFSSIHHEGWVFGPRLTFQKADFIPRTGLNLGISAGPMFADGNYHGYYYAVEPAYAGRARPPYAAGGGYGGSSFTIGLNKSIKSFIVNAFVSMDFLHGAAFEDSPLVKTKYSVMSGISVSWIFFKSAKMVTKEG